MIELGIVDLSAEGRRRLASVIDRWAWSPPVSHISLPRISSHLLSPEEIRFHGSIDVCVVGPELIECDAAFVNAIRQQLPDKVVLAVLDARTYTFALVDQLGRLGIDDVLMDTATSEEFFRRVLLLQRRIQAKKKGRLVVVDSARGGVGRTFISAALGEGWFVQGLSVCVVDCDPLSQDLTRFLQVRPCVSEGLRLLIDQQRVATGETVLECVTPVWASEPKFVCLPPAAGRDEGIYTSVVAQRGLQSVLEILLVHYDRVVVDTSGLVSAARNMLYQTADDVIFVMNRDVSAAFANRQALSLVSGFMRHDAALITVVNDTGVGVAALTLIRKEVAVTSGRAMSVVVVPRSRRAAAWMCSGYTAYRSLRRSLDAICCNTPHTTSIRARCARWIEDIAVMVRAFLRRASTVPLLRRWGLGRGCTDFARGAPQLAAGAHPRIGIGWTMPDGDILVSKPVLLE
jgi:MinD-like ATPase involved in chromosome partitioning or flagellar assembly